MIQLEDLSKRYGDKAAVFAVPLETETGRVVGPQDPYDDGRAGDGS